jgi:preprotein translocase subunit YajC
MFSLAFAEGITSSPQSSLLSFAPLVFLLIVFYFFILRPQQKRSKSEKEMRNSIRIGDKIITTSGIFGAITQIDDTKNVVSIEVSKGVNITIYKASIAETLTKKEDGK